MAKAESMNQKVWTRSCNAVTLQSCERVCAAPPNLLPLCLTIAASNQTESESPPLHTSLQFDGPTKFDWKLIVYLSRLFTRMNAFLIFYLHLLFANLYHHPLAGMLIIYKTDCEKTDCTSSQVNPVSLSSYTTKRQTHIYDTFLTFDKFKTMQK